MRLAKRAAALCAAKAGKKHARITFHDDSDDCDSQDPNAPPTIDVVDPPIYPPSVKRSFTNMMQGPGAAAYDRWPIPHENQYISTAHCMPLQEIPVHIDCDCRTVHDLDHCCSDPLSDLAGIFIDMHAKAHSTFDDDTRDPNNLMRKFWYRELAGALSHPFRKPLPNCAVARVRQLYPSVTGRYMGYKAN